MLILLLACVPDPGAGTDAGHEELPGDTAGESGGGDTADSADSGDGDTGECPPVLADPEGYAALFDPGVLHEVAISLGEAERAALAADPEGWVDAAIVVDGDAFASVGVKWRGESTQMRWDGKPSWNIGFLHGQDCDVAAGVERFVLDAMTEDPTQARLVVEAAVLERLGRVVPRVVYANVTVDGEAFGLYALVESVDAQFVTHHLGEWEGVVWQGGSGADFTSAGVSAWDDVGGTGDAARLDAVAAVVQGSGDTFYADLGVVMDTADFAAHWAALAAVGDPGTFPYETDDANLLVPDAGLVRLVPDAPESGWDPSFDWRHVDSALGVRCVYDAACSAAVTNALEAAVTALAEVDVAGAAGAAFELSGETVADDPRRPSRAAEVTAARADLEVAFAAWPSALRAQLP